MKKSFLTIVILILFANISKGQVGYLGKRLVVKTNAISGLEGLFRGFEVEYVVKRNLTFCVGFKTSNYATNFNFADFENINSWIRNQDYIFSAPTGLKFENISYDQPNTNTILPGFKNKVKDGDMKSVRRVYDFSFRLYSNSYLSAPHGFYSQYGFGFGSQTYEGGIYYPNTILEVYDGNFTSVKFYEESFERYKKKENIANVYFGLGYQHIFSKWVTLDFNVNMGAGIIGNSKKSNQNSYGNENLAIILNDEKDFSRIGNLLGNASNSYDIYNSFNGPLNSFYFSGYVKLGILIF